VSTSAPGLRLTDLTALWLASVMIGIAVSSVMTEIDTPAVITMLAAVLWFSGTGELAYAAVIGAGGGLAPAVVSALLVSSRFGLLAMSMARKWDAPWWERVAMGHIIGEAQVAAALAAGDGPPGRRAYWRVATAMSTGWFVGSAVGLALGNVVGDPRAIGLDALFPASLVSVVVGARTRRDSSAAVALGAVTAIALTPFAPPGVPILVAAGAAVVALAFPPTGWRRTTAADR